jgi:hypothetical protein
MNIVFIFSLISLREETGQEDFSAASNHLIISRPAHQLIKNEHETSREGHTLVAAIYGVWK